MRAERNDEDVNLYSLTLGDEAKTSAWSNILGLPAPSSNEDPSENQLCIHMDQALLIQIQ